MTPQIEQLLQDVRTGVAELAGSVLALLDELEAERASRAAVATRATQPGTGATP